MRSGFATLSVLLFSAGFANGQADPPASIPPVFKVVAEADKAKGEIVFRDQVLKSVAGQVVAEEHRMEFTLDDVRIITPNGKRVANDDVWKRLKKGTVVVVSADGRMPAESFLKALNAETLVIIPIEENTPPKKN